MCDTTFPHALTEFVGSATEEFDMLTALALHFQIEEEDQLIIPPDRAADYIKCPHCTIDIDISALACTIFICGATTAANCRLHPHDEAAAGAAVANGIRPTVGGQLHPHDEAAARAAVASGVLPPALPGEKPRRGCGRQFRVENGVPIPCTGR
jgi:hypothetical protein